MKLWQKVFLITLVFVNGVVNIISVIVVQTSFQSIVQSERQQAIMKQEYLETIISSYIVNARLHKNKTYLIEDEVINHLKDIYLDQYNIDNDEILILDNHENIVIGEMSELLRSHDDFMNEVHKKNNYLTLIDDFEKKTYLITGSSLLLETQEFYLYTVNDITDLYGEYHDQLFFAQTISFVGSGVLSLILLVIIIQLLKPLKLLNQSLLEIASGNYQLRIEEKGSVEIKELATHINIMTQSVEESAYKLQMLADGRKQFIDHLAHEMKTPLTSIIGFSDILRVKKTITDEERREYASIILAETKRLQSLSTKLLELSTMKNVLLDLENVLVKDLFHDVEVSVSPLLERKQIRLNIDYDNVYLLIDKSLFKSLLYNLLDNAIKASKEKSQIEMCCYQKDDYIEIYIKDYGIGMSQEYIDKVTEPFYVIDNSYSRKEGGTGIGLSLCLEIAKKHHAKLEIESQLNQGTCVKILMKGVEPSEKGQ